MWQVVVDAVENLLALLLQKVPQDDVIWLEQCVGPQLTTLAGLDRFLPTVTTTTSLLGGLTTTQRKKAIKDKWNIVYQTRQDLTTELESAGSNISVLDNVREAEKTFMKEGELFEDPESGKLGPPVKDFGRLLRVDETSTIRQGHPEELATKLATQLFDPEAKAFEPGKFVETAAKNKETAAVLLVQLRCLDNIYARLRVACAVRGKTQATFSRILALWRTEGDLTIPPSMPSLKGEDTPAIDGHLIEWPPGRLEWKYSISQPPHFFTTVPIYNKCRWFKVDSSAPGVDPCKLSLPGLNCSAKDKELTSAKRFRLLISATADYHIGLMGLDVFFNLDEMGWRKDDGSPKGAVVDPNELRALVRNKPAGSIGDIESGWSSLDVSEDFHAPPSEEKVAWVVAPKRSSTDGAITYAAEIVQEGVFLLEWIRIKRKLPFVNSPQLGPGPYLPDALAYSVYHLGLHRVPAFWASAISHASTKTSDTAIQLNEKVRRQMRATGVTPAQFAEMRRAVIKAPEKAPKDEDTV